MLFKVVFGNMFTPFINETQPAGPQWAPGTYHIQLFIWFDYAKSDRDITTFGHSPAVDISPSSTITSPLTNVIILHHWSLPHRHMTPHSSHLPTPEGNLQKPGMDWLEDDGWLM
jgi:hypothetical protein